MPALSPPSSLPSTRISPRPKPAKVQPKANSNPFAPLSPDLPENALQPSAISQNLTSEPSPVKPGNIRYYTRHTLLTLAKKCKKRGWETPADLAPYEVWFGKPAPAGKADMVDPAIASIGQPGGGRRGQPGGMGSGGGGGGFGEGFGFGGGIGGGGRGIGRGGGRNIGLRRQNNDQAPEGDRTIQQQMNKLVAKTNGGGRQQPDNRDRDRDRDRGQPMRMGNNDGRNEWRRDNYNQAGPRMTPQEDEAEPAWMDDSAPEPDPAIAQMDPLIHFVPGEDMIAKHKQTMKERDERWRFGGAPSSAPAESKPKVFNNADYLRPNKVVSLTPDVIEAAQQQPEQPSTAFASRFQRFFAAEQQQQHLQQQSAPPPPPPQQQAPPPPPPPQSAPPSKPDDHASRLMGLLSLSETHRDPPHSHMPLHQMNHPMTSPPPPFLPPPQMHHPQAYEHNTPHALLQQLYNPSGAPPRPQQLPPHMMLPPQLPAGYGGAPSYARPPFPPPQFYGQGPPQPPQHFQHQPIPPPHVLHPHPGPPGFGHRPPLPPGMDRQQEILNTLFAGLGPGR